MKIGDLVKNRHNNKVGIIMGYIKTYRCAGTMYGVFIDGEDVCTTRNRLGGLMIGRLVRCKNNNKVGIVLHREITRRGNFRYHVFMGGEIVS